MKHSVACVILKTTHNQSNGYQEGEMVKAEAHGLQASHDSSFFFRMLDILLLHFLEDQRR